MSVTKYRTFVRSDVMVESESFPTAAPALRKLHAHEKDAGLERLELCVVEVSDATWKREQDAKAKAKAKAKAQG